MLDLLRGTIVEKKSEGLGGIKFFKEVSNGSTAGKSGSAINKEQSGFIENNLSFASIYRSFIPREALG